jgi:hypothetical protein
MPSLDVVARLEPYLLYDPLKRTRSLSPVPPLESASGRYERPPRFASTVARPNSDWHITEKRFAQAEVRSGHD